ncbi:MAG: ankyrin repeat domain-containing protein [Tissierellia bacterium]|jgi:ankyrin repeat protein|nr:ankyrin repeat domain-containing protein [Tissierellia bacterium]
MEDNQNKRDEMIKFLDSITEDMNKTFMGYIKSKNYKRIEELIKSQYRLDFEVQSLSPLMLAAYLNDNYLIELLINGGADVNKGYKNNAGIYRTPIRYAIIVSIENNKHESNIDLETIKMLLNYGAKYDDIDLQYAQKNQKLRSLLEEYKTNYSPNSSQADFMDKAAVLFVDRLIAENKSYNDLSDQEKNYVNQIFIEFIKNKTNKDKIKELIDFGIYIDFVHSKANATPLMFAVIANDIATIKILLQANANINKSLIDEKVTYTAFSLALESYKIHKQSDVVELLLENGAIFTDRDYVMAMSLDIDNILKRYPDNAEISLRNTDWNNKTLINKDNIKVESVNSYNEQNKEMKNDFENKLGTNKNDNGACYIATAVYGDYDCSEVIVLRRFRDEYLLTNLIGKKLVVFYYKYSPKLAMKLKHNNTLNIIVKKLLNLIVLILRIKPKKK